MRLCFALGTWQLISLAAALKQADAEGRVRQSPFTELVLHEPDVLPELRQWMDILAPLVYAWDRAVWDNELLRTRPPTDQWPFPVEKWTRELRTQFQVDEVDEVWLPHFEGFQYRLVMEVFPGADVVMYEDGYLGPLATHRTNGREALRVCRALPALLLRRELKVFLASLRLSNWRLLETYLRRTKDMYLLVGAVLPVPELYRGIPVHRVEVDRFMEVMESATKDARMQTALEALEVAPPNEVLILSQMFGTRQMGISWEDELNINRGVVREILDKGYTVCWKDHPRDALSFYPELEAEFGGRGLRRLETPAAIPVQLLMRKLRFRHCVSIASSALFYLRMMYGTAAYTFADRLLPYLRAKADYLCFPIMLSQLGNLDALQPVSRSSGE